MKNTYLQSIFLICILTLLVFYYLFIQNKQDQELSTKTSQHIQLIHISNSISSYAKRAEGHLLLYLMLDNKADREKFYKREEKLKEKITQLKPLLIKNQLQEYSTRLESDHKNLVTKTTSLLEQYDTAEDKNTFFKKNESLINQIHSHSSDIRKLGVEIVGLSTTYLDSEKDDLESKNYTQYTILIILSALAFFFLVFILFQSQKLSSSRKKSESLFSMTNTDPLTSAGNRRLLDSEFAREWNRAIRNNVPLSLLFIDLDDFKLFNDTYGHMKGDECLARIAVTLKSCLQRPTDLLIRYGGEEFIIILPETNDPHHVAELCRSSIESMGIENKNARFGVITVSIGTGIILPTPETSHEDFIEYVDKALYLAKKNGKNCIKDYLDISLIRQL